MNTRVNFDIKSRRVLLIGEDGTKMGIFSTRDALGRAADLELDLVQVSADQEIPVCKILDYGRLQYEVNKSKKAQKAQKLTLKEIRLSPTTEDNDINVRIKAANNFLEKGNHVKFSIRVKGRANAHKGLVISKLQSILERVNGRVENGPSFSGNVCTALVVPEPK